MHGKSCVAWALVALFGGCTGEKTVDMTGDQIQKKLDGMAGAGTRIDSDSVDGKHASEFAPTSHTHNGDEITSKVASAVEADSVSWTGVTGAPSTFTPSAHTHVGADVTTKVAAAMDADSVPWSGVTGVPSNFTPSAHSHPGSQVTGQVANAASADAVPWSGVTGKPFFAVPIRVVDAAGNNLGAVLGPVGQGWDAHILYLDQAGVIWLLTIRDGSYAGTIHGQAYFQSTGCAGPMFLSDWEGDQNAVFFAGNAYVGTGVMRADLPYASTRDAAGNCTNSSSAVGMRPVRLVGPIPSPVPVPVRLQP